MVGVHELKEKQICQTDGMTNTVMREEVLPHVIAIIHAEAAQAEVMNMMTDAEVLQAVHAETGIMRKDHGQPHQEEVIMMMTAEHMPKAVPDLLQAGKRAKRQNGKREP